MPSTWRTLDYNPWFPANLDYRASSSLSVRPSRRVVTFSLELSRSASCSSEATELGGQLSPEVIDVVRLLQFYFLRIVLQLEFFSVEYSLHFAGTFLDSISASWMVDTFLIKYALYINCNFFFSSLVTKSAFHSSLCTIIFHFLFLVKIELFSCKLSENDSQNLEAIHPFGQTERTAMYARFLVMIDPLLKGRSHWRVYLRTAGVGGEMQGGKEIVEKGSACGSPRGPMTPRLDHCVAMLVTDTGDFISDTANSGSLNRECLKRVRARQRKTMSERQREKRIEEASWRKWGNVDEGGQK